jgi:hypothetical protein
VNLKKFADKASFQRPSNWKVGMEGGRKRSLFLPFHPNPYGLDGMEGRIGAGREWKLWFFASKETR